MSGSPYPSAMVASRVPALRAFATLLVAVAAGLASAAPASAAAPVQRCGTIAVPDTQARAAVSLRGTRLACTSAKRVVRTAYEHSVLIGDTRPFTVRDGGRSFRCRYTPKTGGMVCEGRGRRLRGTI